MTTKSFFIGRTDVDQRSGLQRSFGMFDTEDAAASYAAGLPMAGTFTIFEGRPVREIVLAPQAPQVTSLR
jgi:hypothetical protein